MIRRLKSTSGETITEVLVAALVVVLGVLLYTMMVQASFRIINNSEGAMKKIYDAESKLAIGLAIGEGDDPKTASMSKDLFYTGDSAVSVTFYEESYDESNESLKAYSFGN